MSNSNAAERTKQIWVQDLLHMALHRKKLEAGQTLRVVVESLLLKGLGYTQEKPGEAMSQLQIDLIAETGASSIDDLTKAIYGRGNNSL